MSMIVAGRFQTFNRAEEAAHHLIDNDGFRQDEISVFFVNPPGQHATYPTGGDVHTDAAMQQARASGLGVGTAAGVLVGGAIGYGAMQIMGLNWLAPLIMMGLGAYVGSLIGTMVKAKPAHEDPAHRVTEDLVQEPVRESGVMLAVHVTDATETRAESALRDAGAYDVELASGTWNNGKWSDFNPVAAPVTVH